jgi:uncharacterized protein (TIGR03790 family)
LARFAILFLAFGIAAGICAVTARAQTPDQVLVVVNRQSPQSVEIGQYYLKKRAVPATNLCTISTLPNDDIDRKKYLGEIEEPVGRCLRDKNLVEKILFIVTTNGVPLREDGPGEGFESETASVDSELTLLYQKLHGKAIPTVGPVANPYFKQRDAPFRHPQFPMYVVTRLAAYDMAGMKALVDRSLLARNKGKFVIDLRASDSTPGNQWLRAAALLLPKDRVVLDDSKTIVMNQKDVIGYASWGSNDRDHTQRFLHFQWLPGAIATEFVSTDGRTFQKPPDTWRIGIWGDSRDWFNGSPQSMTGDYLLEGASAASGQVAEPYLAFCPRPDYVLPAYLAGRTLAESFYSGIQGLSWMNVVIGDPLMRLLP